MARICREHWATRLGLILAVAGNAIGLGNFLRFPVQAAENGGGTFMIPYFIAFLLLGIPLMWIEWAIGRYGGQEGHGSAPGIFDALWRNKFAKYFGASGLFISTMILIWYCYVESWTLGYSFFSMVKLYFNETSFDSMKNFLLSYHGITQGDHFASIWPAYLFMLATLGLNFWILGRGLTGGIEKLAKIAMPLLLIFAIILVVRVFTLGTPDPAHPEWNALSGLAFIWNPDFSQLASAKIWLAAAGQIFFTLSLGQGTIQAYASYLKENDDVALSGLTTSSANGFTEVVLGGSLAIPVAVAFFGLEATRQIAHGGAFDLGFVSMPIIFTKIPFGSIFGTMWFLLLFVAGITSSVALAQPAITFLKDEFGFGHKKATYTIGLLVLLCIQPIIFFKGQGFLDEVDFWSGTFGLVIFALIETIIFVWVFGIDKAWAEITRGAEIRIPLVFKFIIKYVTPVYLVFIMVMWAVQDAIPTLFMENVPEANTYYIFGARGLMTGLLLLFLVLIAKAWKRKQPAQGMTRGG